MGYVLKMIGKHIDINYDHPAPSNYEIETSARSLKPGQELPPLIRILYVNQLIAEHYLDELLEGKTLWFDAFNSVVDVYFRFEGNVWLYRTYVIMSEVIECRGLNLKFENKYLPDFKCYGLLLHDYKPCYYECKCGNGCRCNEGYETLIGLRINGDKI